jgi:predicted acylesterase/phospholipase RssA
MSERLPDATFADCAKLCLIVALDLASGRRVVLDRGPAVLGNARQRGGAHPLRLGL